MIMMRRLTVISQVQPRLHWDGDGWAIDFDSFGASNIAALMTIQLMAEMGGDAMKKCRSCPRWFQGTGRQVYCGACGIKAAWRAAAQRRRKKLSAARED
jgi:rRNA maturation endonuclease Nob1